MLEKSLACRAYLYYKIFFEIITKKTSQRKTNMI